MEAVSGSCPSPLVALVGNPNCGKTALFTGSTFAHRDPYAHPRDAQRPSAFAGGRCAQLAAQALGSDLAYLGTRFIASTEANANAAYKQMLIDARAEDIIYTSLFSGVAGNYLRGSVERTGLDPDRLPEADKTKMNFGTGGNSALKAWKDIWSAGQSVSGIHEIATVDALIERMSGEYQAARARIDHSAFAN